MEPLRLSPGVRETYIKLYKNKGETGLYKWSLGQGVLKTGLVSSPDIELLDLADGFFALSRATGEKNYFAIGRALRKAAHKLYRTMIKINPDRPTNSRFLNVVGG